jgi:hypothetical protein
MAQSWLAASRRTDSNARGMYGLNITDLTCNYAP